MIDKVKQAQFTPGGIFGVLSKSEVALLLDTSQGGLYRLFRNCALAVINCGSDIDDGHQLFSLYKDFDIRIVQQERGISLVLNNAPANAFVDGEIIQGIREHVVAVVRDILHAEGLKQLYDLSDSAGITDMVFHLLRNAGVMRPNASTRMAVCWGGHSISREEYAYTKTVGYELGLRSLNVCTGCGPGAMKGPMKGAALGHAKQRFRDGRFLGISEPGIIAAESPNPIVTELVIMPDIEKRLEAFVRVAHGIIVFPGGVGTLEEILYLLGLLLHPDNQQQPLPLIFTGPASARSYFEEVDAFIGTTLGAQAQARYQIIIDDPVQVAQLMTEGIAEVRSYRKQTEDAYYFNWRLSLLSEFQQPFVPNHDAMRALNLSRQQPVHELAANLRRAFSGIVAGNVKDEGVTAVEAHGPFELNGDADVIAPLDTLLASFVDQQRMKLAGAAYRPCYRIGGKG